MTVTVSNTGGSAAEEVQLQLSPHQAICYIGAVAAPEAAVASAILSLGSIKPGESVVTVADFQVAGIPANDEVWLHAQAKGVGTAAAETEAQLFLQPFAPEEKTIPPTGGLLAAEDGRVVFTFPPGWHETEATIAFQLDELYQKLTDETGTLLSFSVEANAAVPVEDFNLPVAVVIQIGDLLPTGEQSSSLQSLVAQSPERLTVYTRAKEGDPWSAVETVIDAVGGNGRLHHHPFFAVPGRD